MITFFLRFRTENLPTYQIKDEDHLASYSAAYDKNHTAKIREEVRWACSAMHLDL